MNHYLPQNVIQITEVTNSFIPKDENSWLSFHEQRFFPLIHDISVNVLIHRYFYNIHYLIFIIQVFFGSFWVTSKHFWPKQSNALDVLSSFIDLRIHHYENALYYYIAGIVFFVFCFLWFVYIEVSFQRAKALFKHQLYITKILFHIVIPVTLPIYGSFLARAFIDFVDYNDVQSLVFLVLYIFIFIFVFYSTYVMIQYKIFSPVTVNSYVMEWTSTIHVLMEIVCTLCSLGPILSRMQQWAQFIYTFCVGTLYLLSLLVMQMYPFYHAYTNLVISLIFFYLSVLEYMLCFKLILFDALPHNISMIVPLVAVIIFIPIYLFLFFKRNKKILEFLSQKNSPFNDAQREEQFDSKKFTTVYQIFPYLQLGIENHSDFIIDFSFIKYLLNKISDKKLYIHLAHIIVFFPNETVLLDSIVKLIEQYEDLNSFEKFFIYQIKKFIIMREKATSPEVSVHLSRLRKISQEMIESIRGLWLEIVISKGQLSYSIFKKMYDNSLKVKMQFVDLMGRYSNNIEMYDEYLNFLVEGLSDFSDAILIKKKKLMIEHGIMVEKDYSFRSFVNVFPNYLTDKIIDKQGKILYEPLSNITNISNHSLKENQYDNTMSSLNEEHINDNIKMIDDTITKGSRRIFIQNIFATATFKNIKKVQTILYCQTILIIILFLFYALYLPTTNDDSISLLNDIQTLSLTSINILINSYYQAIQAAVESNRFSRNDFSEFLILSDEDILLLNSVSNNSLSIIQVYSNINRYFNTFLKSMSTSTQLTSLGRLFTGPTRNMIYFENNSIGNIVTNVSIMQILKYITTISQRNGAATLLNANIQNDSLIDERLASSYNGLIIGLDIENMRLEIIDIWSSISHYEQLSNITVGSVLAILFFCTFIPLQITSIYKLHVEVHDTTKIIHNTRMKIVNESLYPILSNESRRPIATGSFLSVVQNDYMLIILFILGFISAAAPSVLLFIAPYINFRATTSMSNYLTWHLLSSSRLTNSIAATAATFLNLVLTNGNETVYWIYNESVDNVVQSHSELLSGSQISDTIIGAEKELNDFQFLDTCSETVHNMSAYSNFITCISIDRAISYMQYLFMKMINKFTDTVDATDEQTFYDLAAFLELRLISAIQAYQILIVEFVNRRVDYVDDLIVIVSAISIIFSFLFCCSILLALHYLDVVFKGMKQMIRFLPPEEIMNSPNLLSLVYGESILKSDYITQSQAILASNKNGIASISSTGIIETVNTSFLQLTGYHQEEILGKPFLSLFELSNSNDMSDDYDSGLKKISDAINILQNSIDPNMESELSIFLQCRLESGKEIAAQVYVIGLERSDSGEGRSFYSSNGEADSNLNNPLNSSNQSLYKNIFIMMKDLSQDSLEKQKNALLKKKSEDLIKQVVPNEVFKYINSFSNVHNQHEGQPNLLISPYSERILFSSNNAIIIVVKINGLLHEVNTHLPKTVLHIIDSTFNAFNQTLSQYPLLHELMTINDTYIACSGFLRDSDKNPHDLAVQSISYAFALIDLLCSLNTTHVTNFTLSFGICYGGPIYGCVLNPSVPKLHVYGDIFKYARLSVVDAKENIVEISNSTREILGEDKRFSIKKSLSSNRIQQFYEIYDVFQTSC